MHLLLLFSGVSFPLLSTIVRYAHTPSIRTYTVHHAINPRQLKDAAAGMPVLNYKIGRFSVIKPYQ